MIDVEQITIDVSAPSESVRVVAMQPFVRLETIEPFQWVHDAVEGQLMAIRRTLDLAQSGFNTKPTKITLFPEYSIPGSAGVAVIEERISAPEWPRDSIVIAGLHGLRKAEYADLLLSYAPIVSEANSAEAVPDNQWVNCCLIWVKERTGEVRRWVQPKIRPAWPEQQVQFNDMFRGSTIYVFEGRYIPIDYPFRFVTFVCFDWVATADGRTICDEVLSRLNSQWEPNPKQLHWAFVIQHNRGPNHASFLNSTYRFLTDNAQYPLVERQDAVVVHANTAITSKPSRSGNGAFSSCVFSPRALLDCSGCRPTVRTQTALLRGSDILERCKDVVFREMGECIHLFEVSVPRFAVADASGRALPIRRAEVYSTNQCQDPRLCGGPVPASVKWINDSLDNIPLLSKGSLRAVALEIDAAESENIIKGHVRGCSGVKIINYINWATCSVADNVESRDISRRNNVDVWDENEESALEHIIHSLASFGISYSVDVDESSLHGSFDCGDGFVQVVAIKGNTHSDCRSHYDKYVHKVETDPVLVIARDRDNTVPLQEEFSSFIDSVHQDGLFFIDYQTVLCLCRKAKNKEELRRELDAYIPKNRRII